MSGCTQEAVDAHLRELYGDARKRTARFAESAAQLQLEAVANGSSAAGAAGRPQPCPLPPAGNALAARLAPAPEADAVPLRPSGRAAAAPAPGGQRTALLPRPAAQAPQAFGSSHARTATPAVQGVLDQRAANGTAASTVAHPGVGGAMLASAGTGRAQGPAVGAGQARPGAAHPSTAFALAEPIRPPAGHPGMPDRAQAPPELRPPPAARRLAVQLGPDELGLGEAAAVRMLEAVNPAASAPDQARSQLVCFCGKERLWDVTLHGQVAMLCGGAKFSAVGMQSGTVEVR